MRAGSKTFDLADAEATAALGAAMAVALPGSVRAGQASAVLNLKGELGAGKTTCVRGLLRSLGVTSLVRSPTYTLAETYDLAGLSCIHVDLYRLRSLSEIEELGLRDAVTPGCLLLVEWPEKGEGAIPAPDLDMELLYQAGSRQATMSSLTDLGRRWLNDLAYDAR